MGIDNPCGVLPSELLTHILWGLRGIAPRHLIRLERLRRGPYPRVTLEGVHMTPLHRFMRRWRRWAYIFGLSNSRWGMPAHRLTHTVMRRGFSVVSRLYRCPHTSGFIGWERPSNLLPSFLKVFPGNPPRPMSWGWHRWKDLNPQLSYVLSSKCVPVTPHRCPVIRPSDRVCRLMVRYVHGLSLGLGFNVQPTVPCHCHAVFRHLLPPLWTVAKWRG